MPAGRRASRNAGRNDGWKSERRSLAKGSYSVDRRLAPRIRQYIEQFRHGYVPDVEEIADYLQNRYGEYSRKKRNAFRLSVQKVYRAICSKQDEERHLQNLEDKFLKKRRNSPDYSVLLEDKRNQFGDESNSTDEDSTDSDLVLVGDESLMSMDNNLLNQSMQKMYSRSSSSRPVSETEEPSHNLSSNIALAHPKDNKANSGEVLKNSSTSLTSRPSGVSTSVTQEKREDYTKSLNERKLPLTEKRKRDPEEEITSSKEPGKKQKSLKKSRGNNGSKSEKNIESAFSPTLSTVKFSDIGGCDENIHNVCKLLVHMRHPEVFHTIGIAPPQGFLLHGPPGCGKTLFANAIAGELELPLIRIAATEIVSGVSGESEEKVRELFARAVSHSPCVLFIDEIDAITPKRETASKDMERRIVSQLLTCMDELNESKETRVLVIGATNRPDALDPALRRAGRFDREISMGIPDTKARERILKVMCKNLRVKEDFSFAAVAQQTPGFVGADLMALTREAAMVAVNRIFKNLEEEKIKKVEENLVGADSKCEMQGSEIKEVMDSTPTKDVVGSDGEPVAAQHSFSIMRNWIKDERPLEVDQLHRLFVEMEDFKAAFALVQPSAKREGFATIPDVTWDDIGALKDIRGELTMAILAPVRHPEEFSALGLTHPPGILLAGPPGCGKTLLAKAIANESGINFISVKGPELLNMYVGESEKAVRQVFQRARNSSPCVIFFDELDALCPRRSGNSESSVGVRVVNQLLTEMDGLEARKQVFIMGATNRPDIIDPAVLRPGRLDKVLYVGLPSESDREEILRTITKNGARPRLQPDVDIKQLARDERCHGFSGADLAALVREAAVTALRDVIGTSMGQSVRMMDKKETWNKETVAVGLQHFEKAFRKVKPSVSSKDQVVYERIKEFAARL